jgi:hypothetical protein
MIYQCYVAVSSVQYYSYIYYVRGQILIITKTYPWIIINLYNSLFSDIIFNGLLSKFRKDMYYDLHMT